jgi:hypothetical protein
MLQSGSGFRVEYADSVKRELLLEQSLISGFIEKIVAMRLESVSENFKMKMDKVNPCETFDLLVCCHFNLSSL